MFDEVLRTRLDRRLFVAASILSVITLTTGALAVHANETQRAERVSSQLVLAQTAAPDAGVE